MKFGDDKLTFHAIIGKPFTEFVADNEEHRHRILDFLFGKIIQINAWNSFQVLTQYITFTF